jgi:alpha-L-rhamnosidase
MKKTVIKTSINYLFKRLFRIMRMNLFFIIFLIIPLSSINCAPNGGVSNAQVLFTSELRCEYSDNPLGLDTQLPRFSWILTSSQRGQMQTAYQILVASSPENLSKEKGDKWDSKKLTSGQSVNVVYQGKELASGEKCWWKVRVWDKDGKAGAFSEPATFEMGLLKQSDWQGQWIGADTSISSPLLRREFTISGDIKRARAYISGLGWNEFYINGKKVGDHVLDPATTDYKKHIKYSLYDVTDLLRQGENAIGVMLGNGWFSEPGQLKYGDSPRLLLQINIDLMDSSTTSIKTDENWKISSGPIVRNSIWGGETYDARLEKTGWADVGYDDSGWDNAIVKENPGVKDITINARD